MSSASADPPRATEPKGVLSCVRPVREDMSSPVCVLSKQAARLGLTRPVPARSRATRWPLLVKEVADDPLKDYLEWAVMAWVEVEPFRPVRGDLDNDSKC